MALVTLCAFENCNKPVSRLVYIATLSAVGAEVCEDHVPWIDSKSNELEDLTLSLSLARLPNPCTLWEASVYRYLDDACCAYYLLKSFCGILEEIRNGLYPSYDSTLPLLADYTKATVNLGMMRYIRRLERPRKRRRTNRRGGSGGGADVRAGVGAATGAGVGAGADAGAGIGVGRLSR